jgi:hypothetical protein
MRHTDYSLNALAVHTLHSFYMDKPRMLRAKVAPGRK